MIRKLLLAGADAFRINMSHGDHQQKAEIVATIRALEKDLKRPTTILFDLQGPNLRVGKFKGKSAMLAAGERFTLTAGARRAAPSGSRCRTRAVRNHRPATGS